MMATIGILRGCHGALRALDLPQQLLCPDHLADRAYHYELASGTILNPRAKIRADYLPYAAARPVAPLTGGARRSGFLASMSWGASVITSAIRTDLPLIWAFYFTHFEHDFRIRDPQGDEDWAKARRLLRMLVVYAPLALVVSECLFGSGALPAHEGARPREQDLPLRLQRAAQHVGLLGRLNALEIMRHFGIAGVLEASLLEKSNISDGNLGACGWMVLALSVRIFCMPFRATHLVVSAAAAGIGASAGLIYELCNLMMYQACALYGVLTGALHRVPILEAHNQERRDFQLGGLLELDDAWLPAPFIDELWDYPVGRSRNRWAQFGATAARRFTELQNNQVLGARGYGGNAAFVAALEAALRTLQEGPPALAAQPVRPDPRAAAVAHRGVDVHAPGRDPATRAAVAALLALYPAIDEDSCIRQLKELIEHHREQRTTLSRRIHACGIPLLNAAQRSLGLDNSVDHAGYPGILAGSPHTITLDDGRRVTVRRICATVWHAIGQLREGDGEDAGRNLQLREERRDALIVAIADVLNGYNMRVCPAGQTQRIMLVLQGALENINIEDYERIPTVAQFVSYSYHRIVLELGDNADEETVRALYSRTYEEGRRLLPEPLHASLQEQLMALASMEHDVEWAPG